MRRTAWRLLSVWCLATVALAEEADPADPPELQLAIGERRTVPVEGLSRVSVGDPEIADIEVVKGGVVVIGLSEGRTTLLTWAGKERRSYLISVRPRR